MPIVYRTTDMAKWGVGKGANLQPVEVDVNFWELLQAIGAIQLLEPVQISNITVNGNEMTIHMDDASTFGPFTLPTATFRFRGPWAPLTNYLANDLVTADGGLYFVNQNHLSDSAFNPDAASMAGPYYAFVMPFPTTMSIGMSFPGKPGFGIASDEYEQQAMFSYRADRQFYLPADLDGTVGGLYIQADDELVFPIYRNGDEIGDITFDAATTTPVFTFATDQQFEIDDVLRVLRPEDLDATAKDLTVTFQATLGTPTGS